MHAVAHAVRDERTTDLLDDLLVRGDVDEGESQRGGPEPGEVLVELEDASVVQAQAFPDGIAPCTTESKGLTPASSRWSSFPFTLARRSRFPLVKPLQHSVSISLGGSL